MAVSPRKFLLGLIGAPINHSASPAMHEAAAAALGCQAHYQLIEVDNADRERLRALLDGVRNFGFAGVNVTYPYKEAIVPLLDALSEDPTHVGAVNTVVVSDGRLVGHNTDVTGFTRAAAPFVAKYPGPVAIIGAGGVGKAAAVALARTGAIEIRLFDRDSSRAESLAATLSSLIPVRACDSAAAALNECVGLFNGTPVGMWPNTDMPVPRSLLHSGLWVADAVYSPLWTPLLLAARDAGAATMTGRALAINQAADAFALFTGMAPSYEVMAAAFDSVMEERSVANRAA